MEILKASQYYINIIMKLEILSHPQTIFLPKDIALLSYFLSQHFYTSLFCFFPLPNKVVLYLYKRSIVLSCSLVINKRCITLETAKDLQAVILHPRVNCLMFSCFFFLHLVLLGFSSEKFEKVFNSFTYFIL